MIDMNAKERFHLLVEEAIDIQRENAESFNDAFNIFGPLSFAKEIGTIHLNLGRRSGKTEYLKRYATKDDVIIFPHKSRILYKEHVAQLFTAHEVQWRDLSAQRIFIDEPALCFAEAQRDKIYEAFDIDQQTIFILLGE